MGEWNEEQLGRIGAADELRISSLREDGTPSRWVTIWVVRLGNDLYVRSVRGRKSGWYRATQVSRRGSIRAGGIAREVTFVEETDHQRGTEIDQAYRAKYHHYADSIVSSTLTPQARGATLRLKPYE